MRYHIVDSDQYFDDYEDAVDYCIDYDYHQDDDYFEEWINDCYGSVQIGGYEYSAYDVLDKMNDLSDFLDSYIESQNESDKDNAMYELRHADVGDVIDCQAYSIEVVADEEDEEDIESTGDYDGDETAIDRARRFYDEQTVLAKQKLEEEQKEEDDMMRLFQVINK